MSTTVSLAAERRDGSGKGAARQMRLGGRVPAVIYGRGRAAESLSVAGWAIEQILSQGASSSTLIDLAVGDKSETVLMREVQRHPVRQSVTHVDFYAVRAGETITVSVPIHLDGIASGVRNAGATLDQVLREVTISVLPRNIPDRLSLDVTELEIGQSLHVSDLVVENAKVMADPEATICSIIAPRVEEVEPTEDEEAEVEEEGAEPELIRKPKDEGEDEGAEGEG